MLWLVGLTGVLIVGLVIVAIKRAHWLIAAAVVTVTMSCLAILAWVNHKTGIRHAIHLVTKPDDLYSPVVTDSFPLWIAGFSKSYTLAPKYMDIYEIGLQRADGGLIEAKPFAGKVKCEFLSGSAVVDQAEVSKNQGGVYAGTDSGYYKKMRLATFEVPLLGKHMNNVAIKLTVLEADKNLEKYADSLQVYIAVSSSP